MRITHLGHACLLIEAAGQRILIDPGAFVPDFADATDLDAIVVTHQHADHLDQKRILDIRRRNRSALVVADPQSTAILVGLGIDTTAQDGTDHQVGPVTIRPVGKKHALIHKDWPIIDNVGVVVTQEVPEAVEGIQNALEKNLKKGRVVERLVGKVEQIVTKPIATEVRARFFDKGLKLPARAVEELQGKEPGQ